MSRLFTFTQSVLKNSSTFDNFTHRRGLHRRRFLCTSVLTPAPHFASALIAICLLAITLVVGTVYAEQAEAKAVHGFAPWMFGQKNQGSALQRVAFQQTDLSPLYGSSELNFEDPYQPTKLFWDYPSGFMVFPVGMADTEPLIMLQKFAAIAHDMRGKKVVISLSPSFYHEGMYHEEMYNGNFSSLHANALAFGTELSLSVKQGMAIRMLEYPQTLRKDPVLRVALEQLADGSLPRLALYYLMLPLGQLHVTILNLQDHWEMINFIDARKEGLAGKIPHNPRQLNWKKLATRAENEYKQQRSTNNDFGMENNQYLRYKSEILKAKNSTNDEKFIQLVQRSKGWTDLDLLLRGLQEIGAKPLVILIPMNGGWFDWQGISLTARNQIYRGVEISVRQHNIPFVSFDDHDGDKYFLIDPGAHLSSKGWIFYAQALDAFYHDTLR